MINALLTVVGLVVVLVVVVVVVSVVAVVVVVFCHDFFSFKKFSCIFPVITSMPFTVVVVVVVDVVVTLTTSMMLGAVTLAPTFVTAFALE